MPSCCLRESGKSLSIILAAILVISGSLFAYKTKDTKNLLDELAYISPMLRVTDTVADTKFAPVPIPNLAAINSMLADLGPAWSVAMELRTGRPTLIEGGAIPWFPGPANSLAWESLGAGCRENSCVPVSTVETLARQFIARYPQVFMLDGYDLVIDKDGSGPFWNSIYFLRFQLYYKGVIIRGASVIFRINNGNLIQVVVDRVGTLPADATPIFNLNGAWSVMYGHIGGEGMDTVIDKGTLEFVPVTPKGLNPEVFNGQVGSMLENALVWRFSFQRKGEVGTWEALVDARTGDLLQFVDSNRYGHIHGGIRPSDGLPPEENRPFPWCDTGLASPNNYSDAAGNFPGNNATSTLVGKYAHINDACGAISNTTTTGDLDFLIDNAAGSDCVVPPGNTAGPGNTHSSRTLFYNLAAINLKAQIYAPLNTWLTSTYMTANVNGGAMCNASSGGGVVNFYKRDSSGCATPDPWTCCNNLGEIPGVAMHEWAHGYDTNDGSGGQSPPLETYADFTAIIQTHNSCTGAGFFQPGHGFNCEGYGDACTACTGIRDCDWAKHAHNTPWTSANNGTVYTCGAGKYSGPCGWEDHCESGIASQALWDFVYRDLTATCPGGPMCAPAGFSPLDLTSAWMLEDRLWFTGVATLTAFYTCSGGATDGCSGTVLYSVMRALDDDGDGTANGTPHAHAIYHALARHNMACSTWNDASVQNQNQTSCPALTTPTLTGLSGSNQATLNWTTGGASATRYFVYRNESGCDVAFNRIAIVTAPTLTYTDNAVSNGTTYYYRVQAATGNDSCTSPSSNCATVTPQPCMGSVSLEKTLYNCSDTVNVSVLDSTPGSSPWTIQAWSTTDATHKTITLANNPPASATYTGSFTTTTGTPGATQVKVSNGDTLTVQYIDPDWCGAGSHTVTTTATIDCVGPVISNVQAINVTGNSADITWTTNELSNSYVVYDTATPPAASNASGAALVTSHSIHLIGLTECTPYYFYVRSTDAAANQATDNNGGSYYTFSTGKNTQPTYTKTETPPLAIPDNTPAGVSSVINVTDNKTVQKVIVTVDSLSHTYDGDLTLSLIGPDATAVTLSAAHGGTGENYTGTVFDDASSTTIASGTPPYTGTFKPDSPLSAFIGKNSLGNWSLHVVDGAGSDTGTINTWSITLTYPAAACGPHAKYSTHTRVADTCSSGGAGNNNTYWDAGEAVQFSVALENDGTVQLTGITAVVVPLTAGVTMIDDTASYNNINAGNTGVSLSPHFTVQLPTTLTCGSTLNFRIDVTTAQGSWSSNFSQLVGQIIPGVTTPINEAFTTGNPPTGWSRVNGGTGTQQWTTANPGAKCAAWPTSPFEIIDSDYDGSGVTQDDSLISPAFDSTGATLVQLSFDTYYYAYSNSVADVDVSIDNGGTWASNVVHWTTTSLGSCAAPSHQTIDITAAAGTHTQVKLRFHYTGTYAWYWLVDNVQVAVTRAATCNMTTCVASCTPPGAPNLTSATGTCAGVTLNWTAGTGTTNAYNVYRSANTSCPVGTLTKLNASPIPAGTLTYNDTTAVGGTTYTYVVRGACDAGGTLESGNSNCLAAARLASPTPTITCNPVACANTCPATTVVLTTESGKSSYQWYNGGSPIGGATTYQYTVTATGSYTVSYTDTNGCSGTSAAKAVTISACAPNIVYQTHGTITSVDTNGNGTMEAGEKWSVRVTLQNTGNLAADNVQASLSGMALGDGISVCNNPGIFGTISAGGTASYTFIFVVDPAKWYGTYACGSTLTFNVVGKSTTTPGCACANEMAVFSNAVGIAAGNETATQVTTPLNATSNTVNSNLAAAFTITTPAATASLSYTSNYTQKPGGTMTLFTDDFTANLGNWTTGGNAAWNAGVAHCTVANNGWARMTAPSGSLTLTSAVSTVGYTGIHLLWQHKHSNNNCSLAVEWYNGTTWAAVTGSPFTGNTTWQCSNDVTLPAGAEGNANLKVRFTLTTSGTTRTTDMDYVRITGAGVASGSWAANAQVSLVDPSSTVTVLKGYGAADANPYNVLAYYTGPGTYVIRLEENNGGTATLTAGSMNVTKGGTCATWTAGCVATAPEVSSTAPTAMKVAKGSTPGLVVLEFEDVAGMTGFNFYEGNIGAWYSHGSAPGNACNVSTTAASGRRTTPAAGLGTAGDHYYLVTAYTTVEGPSGYNSSSAEINPALNTCLP